MAEKSSNRKLLIVVIAVITIVCACVIALVGTGAYYVSRHVQSDYVTTESAEARFAAARRQLAGKLPLVELRGGDDPVVHHPPVDARPAKINALRALLYNPHDRRLMDLTLPVWLLRMGSGDHLNFVGDNDHFDTRRMHLSFADVERHGPGLIVDGAIEHGALILIWTE